jgi:tRNA(fMet)-specific endonuclease VapC
VIFVLDTTAFSAAMRFEPAMMKFLSEHRPGEIATVPPVVAEIEYGIRRLDETSRKALLLETRKAELLEHIRLLDWIADASEHFGRIKAVLEKKGTPLDDFDVAIAAVAIAHEAEIVTANLVHFRRVDGLASRHWSG